MYNFNAGPATLPKEVLQQAAEAVLDLDHTGLSLLEIPHRGRQFAAILEEASALVNELCGLEGAYEILWLQGGGRMAFCLFPMNYLHAGSTAAYVDSGHWSTAAWESAIPFGEAEKIGSFTTQSYTQLPSLPPALHLYTYVHLTTNNTIEGTQWKSLPEVGSPIIADMSSDILSCERDYKKCAAFYAVAQKNLGPAGVTLYAIHKDFLKKGNTELPGILSFIEEAKQHSVLNTPPVFAIYTTLLSLRWIKAQGLPNLYRRNQEKAALLYQEIDRNTLFHCPILPADRSEMNVVFLGKDENIEQQFLAFAQQHDIVNIAGHRSVGAFRASLYNAIDTESVQHLVKVMQAFEEGYK